MRGEVARRAEAPEGLQVPLALVQKLPARRRQAPLGASSHRHVIAGLFAGVGGIELGMQRGGHRAALLCDNDAAAMAVLRARFGTAVTYHDDVVTLRELPDGVSLVTAGFPCQDLSQAGATKGIAGSRSGLVGEVFRLIRQLRVPWVLLENVPFMLQLARGEAMNVIATAFEDLGYRWAYRVVDSRAFGLPQRRRRVYLIASRDEDPRSILFADERGAPPEQGLDGRSVACGFYWTEGLRGLGWAVDAVPTLKGGSTIGIPSPPAILMPDRRVVTPDIVDAERLQGFRANWTKPAERVGRASARWKLVGNAVNVRAAEWIGKRMSKPGQVLQYGLAPLRDHRHWPCAAWNVGSGRFRVEASEWPVRRRYVPLLDFVTEGKLKPLSAKAARGFLARAAVAKLRFEPGFIDALKSHERMMDRAENDASASTRSRPRRRR
jgi:DNA (cytosine-5)-methyltransferase 1